MVGDENVSTYGAEGEEIQFVCINGSGNSKYKLASLEIVDADENDVPYTPVENLIDVFTFVMPGKEICITSKYDDLNQPTIIGKCVYDDEEFTVFEERSEGDECEDKAWALKKGTKVRISTEDIENDIEGYIYVHKLSEAYDTAFDSCDEKFLFTNDEGKDYKEIELEENCEILVTVKENRDDPNVSTAYAKIIVFDESTAVDELEYTKASNKDIVIPVNLNGNLVERVWLDDIEITDKITVNDGKVIIPADLTEVSELEVREEPYPISISYIPGGSEDLELFEGSDVVESTNIDLYVIGKSGWVYESGKWYYFGEDGKMIENETIVIDGKEYTFDASGAMQ